MGRVLGTRRRRDEFYLGPWGRLCKEVSSDREGFCMRPRSFQAEGAGRPREVLGVCEKWEFPVAGGKGMWEAPARG